MSTSPGDRAESGPPAGAAGRPGERADLRRRISDLLHEHHQATIATVAPPDESNDCGAPHAATVFYALDDRLRLVFVSKDSSRHGRHICDGGRVAVTVSGVYDDWREIRGVQLWGLAERLHGVARVAALTVYVRRFPFVSGLLRDPRLIRRLHDIGVYRFTPERAALTDNTSGLFGQEMLEDLLDPTAEKEPFGVLRGIVVTGKREGSDFVAIEWVKRQLADLLGADPYPGTLNLELRDADSLRAWRRLALTGACLEVTPEADGFCAASYFPVLLEGAIPAGIVLPRVEGYPEDVVEIVAGEQLRARLDLRDGDEVMLAHGGSEEQPGVGE